MKAIDSNGNSRDISIKQLKELIGDVGAKKILLWSLMNKILFHHMCKRKYTPKEYNADIYSLDYFIEVLCIFPRFIQLTKDGKIMTFKIDLIAGINPLRMIYEVIICDQYNFTECIQKGSIVIDAGANMGVASIYAANLGAKIIAFEPIPELGELFKLNMANNSLVSKNITLVDCALSNKRENKVIQVHRNIYSGGSSFHKDVIGFSAYKNLKVKCIPLDSLKIKPDVIKIDTEGHEKAILIGAARTIQHNLPIITMSGYHNPTDEQTLIKTLRKFGSYNYGVLTEAEKVLYCYPEMP